MSEEFKDANVDESNMNVDDNVQYSSWQEAIGAIRTELLDRVRDEVNQSLEKGLGAILTSLDTKMESIISSKLSTTVVQKDDETITMLQTSINDVAKLMTENATRIVQIDTKFKGFYETAKQEILTSLVESVKNQMQEGIEEIREKLVEYKDETEKYRDTVQALTENVSDLTSQQVLNTAELDNLAERLSGGDKDADEDDPGGDLTGHTRSRVTVGRGTDRRGPPTAKKKVEFSTTQVRGDKAKNKRMSILGREHFPAALEPEMMDDSDPDANEVSSDEEELLVDSRLSTTARTRWLSVCKRKLGTRCLRMVVL